MKRSLCAQSGVGFCETIHRPKNSDRTTCYTPVEAKVIRAPTSTRPGEREFVVDSRASMHMMSKKELSSGELDTVTENPYSDMTANGEVQINVGTQVSVHDLNLFVTVQLLNETPAVVSPGKLCEDHG